VAVSQTPVRLSAFYARYRQDGWGRAAYDPAMMVKVHANASRDANADYERIAREILKEAAEVDAAEDELYGEKRGDELPEHLSTSQGRRGWLCEAKRQLDEERAKEARPIARSRPARLKEAKRRLEQELWVESRANAAYETYRVHGRASDGKRLGATPTPYTSPEVPAGKMNLDDPDSRVLKATRGYVHGYNAQAAVDGNQIVIAAAEEPARRSPGSGRLQASPGERHPGRLREDGIVAIGPARSIGGAARGFPRS
jgi:hypothetical protein